MDIVEKLVKCLEEMGIILDIDEDVDENIFEYGLDSLSYIYLICTIEELFHIEIPERFLINNGELTLRKLELMVKEA